MVSGDNGVKPTHLAKTDKYSELPEMAREKAAAIYLKMTEAQIVLAVEKKELSEVKQAVKKI